MKFTPQNHKVGVLGVWPQIILTSACKENMYDHHHPEVLLRAKEIGAAILCTDVMGSISVIWVACWQSSCGPRKQLIACFLDHVEPYKGIYY